MKLAVVLLIISVYTVVANGKRRDIGKIIFQYVNEICNVQETETGSQDPSHAESQQISDFNNMMKNESSLMNLKTAMHFFQHNTKKFLHKYRGLNDSLYQTKINTEIKLGCQPKMSAKVNTQLHIMIHLTTYSLALDKKMILDFKNVQFDEKVSKKECEKDLKKLKNELEQVACNMKQLIMQEPVSKLDTVINSMVAKKKKDIEKIFLERLFNLIQSANKFVSSVQFSDDHSVSVANSNHCIPGGKKTKKSVKKSKDKSKKNNKTKQRNNGDKSGKILKKKPIHA